MSGIVEFPASFPTEAVTEALRILRAKSVAAEKSLLARCGVTLQLWAMGKMLGGPQIYDEPPPVVCTEEELCKHLEALSASDIDLVQTFNPVMILQIAAAIKQVIDLFRRP